MEGIQILENENELTIVIPKAGNMLVAGITGLWCGVFLYSTFQVIRDGLLFRDLDFTVPWILFTLVAVFVFKFFLWNIRGKEKISLNSTSLKITRLGTILSIPSSYETSLIDNFKVNKERTSWWKSFYGISGGHIAFTYQGDLSKFFGQTITDKGAANVVQRLNERLARIKSTLPQ